MPAFFAKNLNRALNGHFHEHNGHFNLISLQRCEADFPPAIISSGYLFLYDTP